MIRYFCAYDNYKDKQDIRKSCGHHERSETEMYKPVTYIYTSNEQPEKIFTPLHHNAERKKERICREQTASRLETLNDHDRKQLRNQTLVEVQLVFRLAAWKS